MCFNYVTLINFPNAIKLIVNGKMMILYLRENQV